MVRDSELADTQTGLQSHKVPLYTACDGHGRVAARAYQVVAGDALLIQGSAFCNQALLRAGVHL